MGYIELSLEFMGHTFGDMGFLIVKDLVGTPLVERMRLVPGVIGSKIFKYIKDSLSSRGQLNLQLSTRNFTHRLNARKCGHYNMD